MNEIISKQIYHEKERKQARKKYDIGGHEGRHKKEQERKKERKKEGITSLVSIDAIFSRPYSKPVDVKV